MKSRFTAILAVVADGDKTLGRPQVAVQMHLSRAWTSTNTIEALRDKQAACSMGDADLLSLDAAIESVPGGLRSHLL